MSRKWHRPDRKRKTATPILSVKTSFKDARNLLSDSYNDGTIDEDEFFVLYEEHFSKNPEFPYEQYEQFDMDAMDLSQLDLLSQSVPLMRLPLLLYQSRFQFHVLLF